MPIDLASRAASARQTSSKIRWTDLLTNGVHLSIHFLLMDVQQLAKPSMAVLKVGDVDTGLQDPGNVRKDLDQVFDQQTETMCLYNSEQMLGTHHIHLYNLSCIISNTLVQSSSSISMHLTNQVHQPVVFLLKHAKSFLNS